MSYPCQAWHLCDLLDGRNRPFRIVQEMTIVEPCPNIKGCFVDDQGRHGTSLYPSAEAVPPPAFDHYYSFKEGPMDTAKIRQMTLASLYKLSHHPPNMTLIYVPLPESDTGVTVTFPEAPEDVQEVHAMVRRPSPCFGLEGHDKPYSNIPHVYTRQEDGTLHAMDLPVTASPESEDAIGKEIDALLKRFYMVGDVNAQAPDADDPCWTDSKGKPVSTKDHPTRNGPTCYLIMLAVNKQIAGLAAVSQKPVFHDREAPKGT